MATLVNKVNPAIRMTAPEIEVHEEEDMYLIPVSDYCIPMYIYDWTLVEEEPEKISNLTWKDIITLEELINRVHYEYRNGIGQESFGKEVLEKFRNIKGIDTDGVEEEPEYYQHFDPDC